MGLQAAATTRGRTVNVDSLTVRSLAATVKEFVMPKLTPKQRETIIRRRGTKSDKTGNPGRIDKLEIHHKDRDPENNDPSNLRVLTPKEHDDLHKRANS